MTTLTSGRAGWALRVCLMASSYRGGSLVLVTGVPNRECWTTNCCCGGEGGLGCVTQGRSTVSSGPPPAPAGLGHRTGRCPKPWQLAGGGCLHCQSWVHSLSSNTESPHSRCQDSCMASEHCRCYFPRAYLAGWARAVLQGCKWGASRLKSRVGAFTDKGLLGRWTRRPLILKNCVCCRVCEDL